MHYNTFYFDDTNLPQIDNTTHSFIRKGTNYVLGTRTFPFDLILNYIITIGYILRTT